MLCNKTMGNKNIWVSLHTVQISGCELQYNMNVPTVKMEHLITMYTIVELYVMMQFLCVRGGSAADIVHLFHDTYAANQLPDDSMMRRWGKGVFN